MLAGSAAPALVTAAVVHGELLALRPFASYNGLVARAAERIVLVGSGLDPKSICPAEVGHAEQGRAAYVAALEGYVSGTPEGMAAWIAHCGRAVELGVTGDDGGLRGAAARRGLTGAAAEARPESGLLTLDRVAAVPTSRYRRWHVHRVTMRARYVPIRSGTLPVTWCGWPVIDGSTSRGCPVFMLGPWGLHALKVILSDVLGLAGR